jgi:phosphoglycerate dehydrogenase-like enzyme
LAETLARADFVVIAAPVTPQTEKLITPERIAEMKTTAYLINVSRGSVIDEAALIAALKSGRITGAALDVFEREPLPAQSELWTLPNVIVTPHTAGLTEKMWGRQYELLSDNLRRYFAGQPLRDIVDKRAGY